jgi:hypothetical protein
MQTSTLAVDEDLRQIINRSEFEQDRLPGFDGSKIDRPAILRDAAVISQILELRIPGEGNPDNPPVFQCSQILDFEDASTVC